MHCDRAGDFNILLQSGSVVDEDILPALGWTLIKCAWTVLYRHQQRTPASANRMSRVVVKLIRWFSSRNLCIQQAVSIQGVSLAAAMQVVGCIDSARKWPFLLISPDIGTHDEELDGCFFQHTGINAPQPVIEPAHLQAREIDLQINEGRGGGKAEVKLADRICIARMCPWADQEFALASLRRAALLAHDLEIAEGILQEDIVPAADIEGWNSDVFMLANNCQWLYLFVLTIHWPGKILKEERSNVLPFERC